MHDGRRLSLRSDLAMIQWLRNNVEGTPVIAEWNDYPIRYGWGNRISVYTGLPAIVGWDWHLRQQMGPLPGSRVRNRIADVRRIYNTPNAELGWTLLRKYNARLVIVGQLERASASPDGIKKFQLGEGVYWDRVFADGLAAVYRVRPSRPTSAPANGSRR